MGFRPFCTQNRVCTILMKQIQAQAAIKIIHIHVHKRNFFSLSLSKVYTRFARSSHRNGRKSEQSRCPTDMAHNVVNKSLCIKVQQSTKQPLALQKQLHYANITVLLRGPHVTVLVSRVTTLFSNKETNRCQLNLLTQCQNLIVIFFGLACFNYYLQGNVPLHVQGNVGNV